jgi:CRISPR/Cas system CSM-associated protein Csm2 small subunit
MGKCIKCGKLTQEEWHDYCGDCFREVKRQGRNRPRGKKDVPRGLSEEYLNGGYFDDRGNLRPELIVTEARSVAQELDKADMTSTALRRFFGKVRFAQRKLDQHGDFLAIVPDILALEPYVANAVTRGVVPHLFKEFLERNVKLAVADSKSFLQGFVKHFEYVVAFFPRK